MNPRREVACRRRILHRHRLAIAAAVPGALLFLWLPLAGAAEDPAKPQESQAPAAPRRLEAGAELRWRSEWRDNADFQPADDFDAFTGQRVRLHLRARLPACGGRLSLFVQAQDVWLFGARSDKVIHDLATNLHQAYFDWKFPGTDRWELRFGRQELIYGQERLIGAFGWDNVGRSFDAARLRFRRDAWAGDFLWARQVDVRRAGARARAGHQDLSGAYVARARGGAPVRTEIYGLFLRDGLRTTGELAGGAPESARIFTAGFRHAWHPENGWRYSAEHAWQFGRRGPDAHRAAMLVAAAGYAWGGHWRPRWQFEYALATGDNDPRDGRSREFHNLFPTNHSFYGYADLVGLRNLHNFRLTAAAALHRKLTAELDYHRFLLAAPRGPWKNAGGRVLGADPSGQSGRDLGQEVDLTFRVPLHKSLGLLAGYSVFLPGRFARQTRGPETHRFGYLQTTIRF